jgi:hypothetical protein
MKLSGLAAAAAILVTSLGLAAAADAQPPMRERTVVRTTVDPRPMTDRTVVRTVVRDGMDRRDMDRRHYGWNRGHHYGWRNHHRNCRTVWRHHRRITTCRTW